MKPTLLLLAGVALLIAACGGDDNRAGEVQAATDAVRADYEAREANIAAALKEAGEWRDKEGVPPLEWGERPAPKFLDARYDKSNKEADGRIFELSAAGDFNTDPKTMLGLFIETGWRDDCGGMMHGRMGPSKLAVEHAFERFMHVRFLCLLLTDDHKEAELGSGTLFTVNFKPAHWKGRALYFDLEQGKLIGGKEISLHNSSKIDFKTESGDEETQRKRAGEACREDLRKQIIAAAEKP